MAGCKTAMGDYVVVVLGTPRQVLQAALDETGGRRISTSSETSVLCGSVQGVGKSAFCYSLLSGGRAAGPEFSDLSPCLSRKEFFSPAVNAEHWLYHGTALAGENDELSLHIVEQTTLTDVDGTPHPESCPYVERATASYLLSPGKLAWTQGRGEQDSNNSKNMPNGAYFPVLSGQRGSQVDVFVVVVDPTCEGVVVRAQWEMLEELVKGLPDGKPCVFVVSKYDDIDQELLQAVKADVEVRFRSPTVFSVSALTGEFIKDVLTHFSSLAGSNSYTPASPGEPRLRRKLSMRKLSAWMPGNKLSR